MHLEIPVHIFYFLLFTQQCIPHEYSPEGWADASNYLRGSLNEEVDPCEDFYSFVCGNWATSRGVGFESELDKVKNDVADKVLELIKNIDIKNDTVSFKKSLKNFYKQCDSRPFDDWKKFIEDTYESLQKYLLPAIIIQDNSSEEIYPWNSTDDGHFWKFVGTIQRELRITFLISAEVQMVEENCKNTPTLLIRPGYFSEINQKTLDIILKEIVSQYHNVTLSEADINDTKSAINEFDTDLRNFFIINSINEFTWYGFEPSVRVKIKLKDLQNQLPYIDWLAYFDGLLPYDVRKAWFSANPTVVVENKQYFDNLTSVLNNHDRIATTNLGFLLILQKYYDFFQQGEVKVTDSSVYDFSVFSNNTCLDLTVRYFSAAVLRLVCEKYGINVENWRNDIIMIKESVFSAFRFLVYSMDWMDPEDKMVLINKVNNIDFYGGIPSWIMSDEIVESKTPYYYSNLSLITNEILAQKELFRQQMKPLITGFIDDSPPNFFQNAFHNPEGASAINIFLGIQVPPVYSYTYPLAVKFGILGKRDKIDKTDKSLREFFVGMIIAHELMHGFGTLLTTGPKFFVKDFRPLKLSNYTKEVLNQKRNCTVPFYNSYCDNGTSCGENTVEENIADSEGLKVAYVAYKFASQTMGNEPLLNNLVDYSSDQLFFISTVRQFCTNVSVTPDKFFSHSPDRVRGEQPFINFPPFAKTFNCPSGSKYFRNQTCSIYGSFWLDDYL